MGGDDDQGAARRDAREGEAAGSPLTPREHVKRALGFDEAARAGDERPTLVYFHWPHGDELHGRKVETLCTRVMDDETAARWSQLFRCVQLDMSATDAELAALIGADRGPGFVALDADLEVVVRVPAVKSSTKLGKALEKAVARFPDYARQLRRRLAEQAEALEEARRLEKRGELQAALDLVDPIRFGKVRVGPEWEKAYAFGILLADRIERGEK